MFFLRILLVLGCFLGVAHGARAMEVRPPILSMSAQPGSSTTTVFLLRNSELSPETYVFTIQGFLPAGEDGQQTFLPLTETVGLPSWLYLSQSRVTLQAGEVVPVTVTFHPPADAKAGAYQAVIFANQIDARGVGGVTLGSRVGVLVFGTVDGEVYRALSVKSFSQQGGSVFSHLPVSFGAVVRNEGEAHEVLQGHVHVQNMWGRSVAILPAFSGERAVRILPHSERRVAIAWGREVAGRGFWSELKAEWSPFALGWYRARFVLDSISSTDSATDILFFVLPWRTLSGFALLVVAVWFVRRRRN